MRRPGINSHARHRGSFAVTPKLCTFISWSVWQGDAVFWVRPLFPYSHLHSQFPPSPAMLPSPELLSNLAAQGRIHGRIPEHRSRGSVDENVYFYLEGESHRAHDGQRGWPAKMTRLAAATRQIRARWPPPCS
eukprot:SAG22_NODE_1521_length_4236_cov_6.669567_4_plen_133_part_00